jgi:ribonuclease R
MELLEKEKKGLTIREIAEKLGCSGRESRPMRKAVMLLRIKGLVDNDRGKRYRIVRKGVAPAVHVKVENEIVPEIPDADVERILRKYGITAAFSGEVLKESEDVAGEAGKLEGRTDLRGFNFVTIDGETAKDFDDAVAVLDGGGDSFRLLVSIADVSHFVKEGRVLDAEAFKRGTSVYFPDRAIPMLPEMLSNDLCSLKPGVDRLTMTADMRFNLHGERIAGSFYPSIIRSRERMTYTNVNRILAGEADVAERYGYLLDDFRRLARLASLIREERTRRGSLDFDIPEAEVIVDAAGLTKDIRRRGRGASEKIIEDFMIAANEAVAEHLESSGENGIFRIHEVPDAADAEEFKEFMGGLGHNIQRNSLTTPLGVQKVLESVKGLPEEPVINMVLLRSMKLAIYSPKNAGHFGLASKCYTHFTSPIRRYPDLMVHRILKHAVARKGKGSPAYSVKRLTEICESTSTSERSAVEAERSILKTRSVYLMQGRVGESFDGTISGVTEFGFFVALDNPFVEGLVRFSGMDGDYYKFDESKRTLVGRKRKRIFQLGARIRVRLYKVDTKMGFIDFVLEDDNDDKGDA